jgi:hypothetical protein
VGAAPIPVARKCSRDLCEHRPDSSGLLATLGAGLPEFRGSVPINVQPLVKVVRCQLWQLLPQMIDCLAALPDRGCGNDKHQGLHIEIKHGTHPF